MLHAALARALARAGAQSATLGPALGDVGWLKARAGDRVGALRVAREGVEYCHHAGNRSTFAGTLSRTRLALVELGHPEPAAVLTGVVTNGPLAAWDALAGVEAEQRDREQALGTLRASLRPDAYKRAVARGAAMTYDEVVEYTLGQLEQLLVDADNE